MIIFIENTLGLALLSAPWLLFGLVAAGLLRAWLPMKVVGKLLLPLLDVIWLYLELPSPAKTLQTSITEESALTPLTLTSLLLLITMAINPVRHLLLHKRSS